MVSYILETSKSFISGKRRIGSQKPRHHNKSETPGIYMEKKSMCCQFSKNWNTYIAHVTSVLD